MLIIVCLVELVLRTTQSVSIFSSNSLYLLLRRSKHSAVGQARASRLSESEELPARQFKYSSMEGHMMFWNDRHDFKV